MKCERCLHRRVCSIRLATQKEDVSVFKCSEYYSWIRMVVFSSIGVVIANVIIDVILYSRRKNLLYNERVAQLVRAVAGKQRS